MRKKGGKMSHDLRDPLPENRDRVDLGVAALSAMEQAAQAESKAQQRPHVTHLIASRMTDAEQAADFKRRLFEAFGQVCAIRDEMKAANMDFNFAWGFDTFGRSTIAITPVKFFP